MKNTEPRPRPQEDAKPHPAAVRAAEKIAACDGDSEEAAEFRAILADAISENAALITAEFRPVLEERSRYKAQYLTGCRLILKEGEKQERLARALRHLMRVTDAAMCGNHSDEDTEDAMDDASTALRDAGMGE